MPPTNLFGLGYGTGPAGYGYPSAGTVVSPPTLSYASPQSWTGGSTISTLSPTTTGATSFAITAGDLPAGLSLNTSTGAITGDVLSGGSGSVTIRATGPGGTADATITYTTPEPTSSLKVAFDPATGVYTTSAGSTPSGNGDPIGCIEDQSGGGYNATQATAGKRPTLVTGVFGSGSKSGVLYDAVDDALFTASVAHGIGTGDFACAYEIKIGAQSGAYQTIWGIGGFSPGDYLHANIHEFYNPGISWAGLSDNTIYRVIVERRGGTIRCYVNGTADATTLVDATSIADGVVGLGADGAADFFPGHIGRWRLYQRSFTANERTFFAAYYG